MAPLWACDANEHLAFVGLFSLGCHVSHGPPDSGTQSATSQGRSGSPSSHKFRARKRIDKNKKIQKGSPLFRGLLANNDFMCISSTSCYRTHHLILHLVLRSPAARAARSVPLNWFPHPGATSLCTHATQAKEECKRRPAAHAEDTEKRFSPPTPSCVTGTAGRRLQSATTHRPIIRSE